MKAFFDSLLLSLSGLLIGAECTRDFGFILGLWLRYISPHPCPHLSLVAPVAALIAAALLLFTPPSPQPPFTSSSADPCVLSPMLNHFRLARLLN